MTFAITIFWNLSTTIIMITFTTATFIAFLHTGLEGVIS